MEDLQTCAQQHIRHWSGSLLVQQALDGERIRHAEAVVQLLDPKKVEVGRIAMHGLAEPLVTLGLCLCSLPQGPGGRSKACDPTQNPTITTKVAQRTLDKRHTAAVSKYKTKVEKLAAAVHQVMQHSTAPPEAAASPAVQGGRSNSSSTGTAKRRSRSAPPRSAAAAELGAAPTSPTQPPVGEKRSVRPARQGLKLRLPVKRQKSQLWCSGRDDAPQLDQARPQATAVSHPAEAGTDAQMMLQQDSPIAAAEPGSVAPSSAATAAGDCSTAPAGTSSCVPGGAAGSADSALPAAAVDSMLVDEPPAPGYFAGMPVEQQQLSSDQTTDGMGGMTEADFLALLNELLLDSALDTQGCEPTQQQGSGGPCQYSNRTALLSAPPPIAAMAAGLLRYSSAGIVPAAGLLCPSPAAVVPVAGLSSAAGVQDALPATAGVLVSREIQAGDGSVSGCPPCRAGPTPVDALRLQQQQLQPAIQAGRLGAPPAPAARLQPLLRQVASNWRGAGAAAAAAAGRPLPGRDSSSSWAGLAAGLPALPPQQMHLHGQGGNRAASAQQGYGPVLDGVQMGEAASDADLHLRLLDCLQLATPGSALQQALLEAVVSQFMPDSAAAASGSTMLRGPPAAAFGMLPVTAATGGSSYQVMGFGSQHRLATNSSNSSGSGRSTHSYAAAPSPAAAAGGAGGYLLRASDDTDWLWQLVRNVADSSVLGMVPAASQAMRGLAGAAAGGYDIRPHLSLLQTILTDARRQQEFVMQGGVVAAPSLKLQQPLSPAEIAEAFSGVVEAMGNLAALASVTHVRPSVSAQPAAVSVPVPSSVSTGTAGGVMPPGWAAVAAGPHAASETQPGLAAGQGNGMLASVQRGEGGMGDAWLDPAWFDNSVMPAVLQNY